MALPSSPTHTSPLRTLLLTEAILKVLGGAIFIVAPSAILKNLCFPPYSPVATALIRNLGTQTLAFSVPLFLAARTDAVSVRSRRIVYWGLLAREGLLAAGLLGQMGWSLLRERLEGRGEVDVDVRAVEEGNAREKREADEDARLEERKLLKGMGWWVAELVPFVVGRMWALGWRGEWFEG